MQKRKKKRKAIWQKKHSLARQKMKARTTVEQAHGAVISTIENSYAAACSFGIMHNLNSLCTNEKSQVIYSLLRGENVHVFGLHLYLYNRKPWTLWYMLTLKSHFVISVHVTK